jgi:hypothetical protein
MTRKDAINHIRVAGYHGDVQRGTRLYIENRVSYAAHLEAFREGAQARRSGMKCSCHDCALHSQVHTAGNGPVSLEKKP